MGENREVLTAFAKVEMELKADEELESDRQAQATAERAFHKKRRLGMLEAQLRMGVTVPPIAVPMPVAQAQVDPNVAPARPPPMPPVPQAQAAPTPMDLSGDVSGIQGLPAVVP